MSRLIYAEDVKALINGLDSLPFEEEVEDLVDRIPTAYDVEKVEKEIETLKLKANKMRKDVEGMEDMDYYDIELYERGREYAFDDVLEIIKAGGSDERS